MCLYVLFCLVLFAVLTCLYESERGGGLLKMLSIFPGVVPQLREGLLLFGGRRDYQLSAVPAPHPPDDQRLPVHPATRPEPQTWCVALFYYFITFQTEQLMIVTNNKMDTE